MKELEKNYNAAEHEAGIYQQWMDSGFFNPDNLSGEPFTITLPPPNVTGTLHLGHAYEDTLQDILIRYNRMKGRKALWLPGTDHAAIATQSKVEKLIATKEAKRKTDLGREAFLERVNKFAADSHDTIVGQLKSMGASVDWSREAYTLDDKRALAVRTAFKAMYEDGLIYRGHKVVNWDPKGQTVISDEEIVHEERDSVLYTFKYSADFPIPIATTRPETKVGDTAVAVHPDDSRYAEFVGKEYDAVFAGVPIHIKVIADETVEKDFGTGALGVTPAHSLIDAALAEKHDIPVKPVINEFAKMTLVPDADALGLNGKKTTEARQMVVDWLKGNNLLTGEEAIKQNIATAERTGGIIEPLPKLQWFIGVDHSFTMKHSEIDGIKEGQEVTLKQLMRHVVETGQIKIDPDRYSKVYLHWIDNLHDWCISRQLWFGHRIPVYYHATCQAHEKRKENEPWTGQMEAIASIDIPKECPRCKSEIINNGDLNQDEDTLDTWFSAGLWTFSTLGWPEKTEDLKTFHPTSVIAPGYEIIFFWVARMILMSTYHLGQIPFKQVLIHGMVRDKQGRKFSKSLNNGIDPMDMRDKYGTDALRFALISSNAVGNDVMFDEQKVKGMKHFGNKLWNISRFVLANVEKGIEGGDSKIISPISDADKLILDQLAKTVATVEENIQSFRLHESAQALYDFVWKDFADVYIEASKPQLAENADATQKENTQAILLHVLIQILKLLHPFMPFITEVLWQKLIEAKLTESGLLLVAKWPDWL